MKILVILLCLLSVSACSLFSPLEMPYVNRFHLEPTMIEKSLPASVKRTHPGILLITQSPASPGYETTQLVKIQDSFTLDSFSEGKWVAAPSKLILDAILNHFMTHSVYEKVVSSPYSGIYSKRLNIQLMHCDAYLLGDKPYARLLIRAQLYEGSSGRLLKTRIFKEKEPLSGRQATDFVAAIHRAMGRLLIQISDYTG